jgi:nickel superoxide dismutase
MATVRRWWPIREAAAHCDIPCGIYDPIAAKIAAQTVQKMVMRIQAAEAPGSGASAADVAAHQNTVSRYITVKEEHADLVKRELDILWHDYFRPDHLEQHPDLHNNVWQANKLASKNKQSVDLEAAKQLVGCVDTIAEVFWATKGVTYDDSVAEVRFGT